MTLKTLGFHKVFYYLTRREILNHCLIEKTITTWAWCPIHPGLLVPEVPSRAWKEHKAILTTMKLSLQEETGMLLSAAYKWLRKQLGIQNVDTVVSNMGAEIIERWKKA
jgi:hypothetical protein